MPRNDYTKYIRKAIRHYWLSKQSALRKNQSGSQIDRGKRGAATAGKTGEFHELSKSTSINRLIAKFVAHVVIESNP